MTHGPASWSPWLSSPYWLRPRAFLRARCNAAFGTIPFSLDEPSQGALALGLQLGSGDVQCFIAAAAAVVRDVGISGPASTGLFRARRTDPPPGHCP